MSKVRLRLTWTVEYDADPEDYEDEDGITPEAMLAIDKESAEEGILTPSDFGHGDDGSTVTVTGEVVHA
jgi:hypothetical protein